MVWLKNNFWGLATIIFVAVACAIIVQVFKKPGQMSVIESQSMDMSAMLPPPGAVPVGITAVEQGSVEGSVTYTGTVQAYTDEDIYPRVTGRVVAMPVYPGDRVRKGQLLVQLDPADSEYNAKREEAEGAEDAAMHNAGIAKEEFEQKRHELDAAKQAEEAAKNAVDEAEAGVSYWRPEVERQKVLLESKVVSLDEYQKEASELRAAEAKLQQAKAKLREATSSKLAAQAAFDASIHHVGHFSSTARQAKAALKNAAIYQKYTRIVAQDDGVVTKRIVSPGVVVNPGMLLLKVAHVRQVRVQAEVASDDAQKLKLGNKVYIKGSEGLKEEVVASITAIFPAADPSSRTFTVEALINNVLPGEGMVGHYRFLPGQYVVMRLLTGKKEALVIPTSAVIWREGKAQVWKASPEGNYKSGKKYQCPMHPEVVSNKPGKCPKCGMDLIAQHPGGRKVAQLMDIEVGLSNADKTEVVSGLAEGDEVIFAGYSQLQPGMPVVATDWGQSGPVKLPLAAEVAGNRLDASNNWTHELMSGAVMVKVSLSPAEGGSNSVVVKTEKHGGGTISGAGIAIKTSMPGMNMPGPNLKGTTGLNGETRLKSDFMSGLWQLKLSVTTPGQESIEGTFDVEVP